VISSGVARTQPTPELSSRIRQQPKCALMRIAISAAISMFVVTSASADAMNGERLAERWCSPCHAAQGRSGSAPALTLIAHTREFTRENLAVSILFFHPTVLQATMTRNEASDLAEYISSLSEGK
jgi:mono/diheme cytochrome c family protein